jgi:DNA-binding MarR family transcriptional regulator
MATPFIMDPQENLADCERAAEALRDYYLRAHRVVDRLMAQHGTSLARTKLLLLVSRSGSVRSTDIASALGQAPRTVTEAIDGLERDGLVRRDPDPDDRRAKRISVTPAGEVAIAASRPVRDRFMLDVFSAIDTDERAELVRLIDKLSARLDEMDGEG